MSQKNLLHIVLWLCGKCLNYFPIEGSVISLNMSFLKTLNLKIMVLQNVTS
jgi:hypothetical protein